IDAVCIGTWPYMHSVMSIAALERGKHVLCEARMAMNAGEGRRMLEASRKAPHLIAQLVPAPHTLEVDATIQTLLGEGFVGEVLAVELNASGGRFLEPDAPMHWRQDISLSGHNILNMGIWYEAMMRWLGPAQRVTAMTKVAVPRRKDGAGATHEVKVPDHVDILAQLAKGGVAHLRFSAVTALAPSSEAWIYGSEGTLRLEAGALRLSGGRRGGAARRELPAPPAPRAAARRRRSARPGSPPRRGSAGGSRRSSSTPSEGARRSRAPTSRMGCATWSSRTRSPAAPPPARPRT